MILYTGDLEPPLTVTLSADDPVDVTSATAVRIIGTRDGGATEAFSRSPSSTAIVGDTTVVTMDWQAGDTDDPGTIRIEVEVEWPGVRPETFRPSGGVQIRPDFGGIAP
jgi:hypothetical protein